MAPSGRCAAAAARQRNERWKRRQPAPQTSIPNVHGQNLLPGRASNVGIAAWAPCHPACLPCCSQPRPQIGSRYSLLRVLGYGSFSSVCLAVDEATGEQVGALHAGREKAGALAASRLQRRCALLGALGGTPSLHRRKPIPRTATRPRRLH